MSGSLNSVAPKGRIVQWILRNSFYWTLGGILVVSLVVPAVVPVYFRDDDVQYLQWARNHSLADCVRPSQAVLFGMFRPIQNVAWWSLYRLAELNPFPYHVALVFTYLVALAAFFAFVRRALSNRIAIAALIAYAVAFYFLTYIVFWFSDLTYTLELMFAHLALWSFALALTRHTLRHLLGAIILFCLAMAAKEPAALIVPLVCGQLLAVHWAKTLPLIRRRLAIATGLMLAAGVAWILSNPALQSRQGVALSQGVAPVVAFIKPRWCFYAAALTAFPTLIVWVAALFLVFQRWLSRVECRAARSHLYALGLAIGGALLLQTSPALALAVLMLASVWLILSRGAAGVGAIWAVPVILGIMTLDYIVRTYLVEASFGMALICGAAVTPMSGIFVTPRTPFLTVARRRWLALLLAIIALGVALCLWPLWSGKIRALQTLSANRQNFAHAITYLIRHPPPAAVPLLVVDYEDLGQVYERDILPLGDEAKAQIQKTMSSESLRAFLAGTEVCVYNVAWWQNHSQVKEAYLLTMNAREEDYLMGMPLQWQPLREWTRGKARAAVYRVRRD